MSGNDDVLLVFARAPVPGQAKTRLIPLLGAAGAADLHAGLVRQTLGRLAGRAGWQTQLWCTPHAQHPFFQHCAQAYGVTLHNQAGDDLGSRMAGALQSALQTCRRAVIIGSDCPDLAVRDVRQAFAALAAGDDVVLGPALDGGYYLLGMREPLPQLFQDIRWGSDAVLRQTRARLRALGRSCHELTEHHDLDTPADLARHHAFLASAGKGDAC